MTVEVLVASMHQTNHGLLQKMNIQSDAIIGNQCDRNEIENFIYQGHKIRYLSFCERGVGLNRNNALMRATADICILADDDMVFDDGYEQKVKTWFARYPQADILIFNIERTASTGYSNPKVKRIRFWNFMRYGAARIAFRRKSISEYGIFFNQNFGGGTPHSSGEDTLFLHSCLQKGLKIYAVPDSIATLSDERESTWFRGYNEKYYCDKGVLFAAVSKFWAPFLCVQDVIRHRHGDISLGDALRYSFKGVRDFCKPVNRIEKETK